MFGPHLRLGDGWRRKSTVSDTDDQPEKTDTGTDADRDAPEGPAAEGESGKPAIAVAISDDGGAAPRVVASGKGAIAEQILRIAFDHGIRVREDAELAEILSLVDVDSEIPLEALAAVAEILAYVYRANAALEAPRQDPREAPEEPQP